MNSLPQGIGLAIQLLSDQIKLLQKKNYVIAIDGYSSSGKSTLARDLSKILKYLHVDSGAMYRAVTLFFIENDIDIDSSDSVNAALDKISISFQSEEGLNTVFLNGKNVTSGIRSMQVSDQVSEVAAVSAVRAKLVQLQRDMSKDEGIIMDGRDIGTVVFPEADVKFFVTASIEVRTQRRHDELTSKGIHLTKTEVGNNLKHRDHIDSTRSDSPLKQAEDAFLLDTTELDRNEMLAAAIKKIHSVGRNTPA